MKPLHLRSVRQKEYVVGAALVSAGPLFILGTNPEQLPLLMLLVPYIMSFLTLFVLGRVIAHFFHPNGHSLSLKTNLIIGIASSLPVLLLILQSLRQFTVRDLSLVLALGVGMTFYVLRADFLK